MSVALRKPAPLSWLVVAAIVVLALNLRPILAATGPLLDDIQATTGLSDHLAGLMTTLPIFVMGLFALTASALQRWLGEVRGIAIGGCVIALACLMRGLWPSAGTMIATAVVAGVGIAMVQALMPSYIKTAQPEQAGRVMGLYSTGIMGGAIFAASLSPSVATASGWPLAQGMWALPAILAVALWIWQARRRRARALPMASDSEAVQQAPVAIWRSGRAWRLMLFFGIGTAAYTLALAWLAPYYLQLGWSPTQSGFLLAAISIGEVIFGLAISAWIGRFRDRRPLVWAILACLAAALTGLLVAPLLLVVPITVLLSIGIGALFPVSLIITLDHAHDARQAGALLGFVQGGGYMLASVMPLVAGALRGAGQSLSLAWMLMLVGTGVLVWMAAAFRPGDGLTAAHAR